MELQVGWAYDGVAASIAVVAQFAVVVALIYEMFRIIPTAVWRESHDIRWVWVLVVFLTPVSLYGVPLYLGALFYVCTVRRKLRRRMRLDPGEAV